MMKNGARQKMSVKLVTLVFASASTCSRNSSGMPRNARRASSGRSRLLHRQGLPSFPQQGDDEKHDRRHDEPVGDDLEDVQLVERHLDRDAGSAPEDVGEDQPDEQPEGPAFAQALVSSPRSASSVLTLSPGATNTLSVFDASKMTEFVRSIGRTGSPGTVIGPRTENMK